jgi:hypothetical protein
MSVEEARNRFGEEESTTLNLKYLRSNQFAVSKSIYLRAELSNREEGNTSLRAIVIWAGFCIIKNEPRS